MSPNSATVAQPDRADAPGNGALNGSVGDMQNRAIRIAVIRGKWSDDNFEPIFLMFCDAAKVGFGELIYPPNDPLARRME